MESCLECGQIELEKYGHKSYCKENDKELHTGSVRLETNVIPKHYGRWKLDPVSYAIINKIPFLEANVIKYVMRHDAKDGVKDIDKAIDYLNIIKQEVYGEQSKRVS